MSSSKKEAIVVDDDRGMREALARLLAAAGFSCATFPSAEDLLEAGPVESSACFVLDIHLPGLSGFDLCRRLAMTGEVPPVVFITAHDDRETREQASRLHASAYLPKPFSGRLLVEAVAGAIEARAASRT
jgi:FixJ family two-component response regulator